MALTALLLTAALLMILLSEVDLTLRYDKELSVTFYVTLFEVQFTGKSKKTEKKSNKNDNTDRKSRLKRVRVYLHVLTEVIKYSEITLNELTIPHSFSAPPALRYREIAAAHTVISLIIAYLSSKALRINEDYDEYTVASDKFSVELSLKMRLFGVLRALIILKRRLSAVTKCERKNDVRN